MLDDLNNTILAAMSCIEDGVIIVSGTRQVEYTNKSAESIFSLPEHAGQKMTFIEAVRDYEVDSLLRKSIETGEQNSAMVKMRQTNKLLLVTIIPATESRYYIAVIKDLTERQHLEEIRRDLMSNISHEFRTPIASIKLLSETLLNNREEDAVTRHNFLGKIAVEADKLARMTDDIRELGAIEKRGAGLNRGAASIGRMIGHVVERLEAQAARKQIDIIVKVEQSVPPVLIDEDRIESVLMNLIHNAVKFTGNGGKITVRAIKEANSILVSVADTGAGMPAQELSRIFERFYKVDKSRSGDGSGLGLSISRHIINAHGGKIWAESEEGKGSTFFFTLPLGT